MSQYTVHLIALPNRAARSSDRACSKTARHGRAILATFYLIPGRNTDISMQSNRNNPEVLYC